MSKPASQEAFRRVVNKFAMNCIYRETENKWLPNVVPHKKLSCGASKMVRMVQSRDTLLGYFRYGIGCFAYEARKEEEFV
jgi:hypothetical protein